VHPCASPLLCVEFIVSHLSRIENVWHISSSCPYGFDYEIAVYGSKATIIQSNAPNIKVWGEKQVEYPELFFWPTIGGKIDGALKEELEHFAKRILEGKESEIVPLKDVIEGIRVTDMLKKGGVNYD